MNRNVLDTFSDGKKRLLVFCHDAIMAAIVWPLSLAIRLGDLEYDFHILSHSIIICFMVKTFTFTAFKLSRGIWKFSSTKDLMSITKAATVSTVISILVLFFWNRLESVPRSAFFIDWILTCFFLGGSRFAYRIWKDGKNFANRTDRTLIIGANETSEQLIREILRDSKSSINPIGIISESPQRVKRTIHGISILGGMSQLEQVKEKVEATHAIIALPELSSKNLKNIISVCINLQLNTKTLPSMKELVDGKIEISKLRPIDLEDLLGRDAVHLSQNSLSSMVKGQTILVSGAGGSIGSELCRQLCRFEPRSLILLDNCELFLYKVELDLKELFPEIKFFSVIADIKDKPRIQDVFAKYMPSSVYHAAAYKHVPMMELNPFEAIKTNVLGTRNLASIAASYDVSRFVMISTDKAVNPTNIMGASKRLAEMVCLEEQLKLGPAKKTNFTVVRFGNVLGSAGSVIPRFLEQIKTGGPITVTHPDITRYFMSIPEASQLVLQASSLGNGGEIFLLEMGEPIKIVDLAKNLIKLSGHSEEEIEIQFTGLRPGEKLFEELLTDEETTLPTSHELVRVAKSRNLPEQFSTLLQNVLSSTETEELLSSMRRLIPEYTPGRPGDEVNDKRTLI